MEIVVVMPLLGWTFLWPFAVVVKRRTDILILIQFIAFNSHWTRVGIHSAYGTMVGIPCTSTFANRFRCKYGSPIKAASIAVLPLPVVVMVLLLQSRGISGRDRNQVPRKQWWRKITKPFEKISHCFRSRSTEPSSALLSNITFRRVCLCQSQTHTHTHTATGTYTPFLTRSHIRTHSDGDCEHCRESVIFSSFVPMQREKKASEIDTQTQRERVKSC